MAASYFDDVGAFHAKFSLPHAEDGGHPGALERGVLMFRVGFILEELTEYCRAESAGDLVKMTDALVDMAYVILGTAHLQRLPFNEAWDEVHRANMTKVRAAGSDDPRSIRGHVLDVVKPPSFKGPDIQAILDRRRRAQ